jgi:hypothetical protein
MCKYVYMDVYRDEMIMYVCMDIYSDEMIDWSGELK